MMSDGGWTIRLGTRGSLLARTQSMMVADALERAVPGVRVELAIVRTSGDRITDRPLHEFGGKGLFTKELEQALLDKEIDFAVHSFKDVPVTMPLVDQSDLVIAAVPPREDPRDVLISRFGKSVTELPPAPRIGTGSLRRRCQVLERRPDALIQPLRGNIDTRIRKLFDGEHDGIILAMAGLKRTKLFDPAVMHPLDAGEMLPAPGQGALALQCRRTDAQTVEALATLNDQTAAACVAAERELVRALQGDCHSPIAALATIDAGVIFLRAAVGGRSGVGPVIRAGGSADRGEAAAAVGQAYHSLLAQGAQSLLAGDQ